MSCCFKCRAVAATDWVVGHPGATLAVVAVAVLLVVVPLVVVHR